MFEIVRSVDTAFLGVAAVSLLVLAITLLRASRAIGAFLGQSSEMLRSLEARLKAIEEAVSALRHQIHSIAQAIRDRKDSES